MKISSQTTMPSLKKYIQGKGFFKSAAVNEILFPECFSGIKKHLESTLRKLSLKADIAKCGGKQIFIGRKKKESSLFPELMKSPEAYSMNIEPNGILLEAASEKGLFMGLKTIEELYAANSGKIPCGKINDAPAIPMRAFHIDLKSGFRNLDELKAFVEELASWKINTLLIEYENRFPYKCVKEAVLPGTPSLREWDDFLKFCRSMYMTVIPLVQAHGHLEYVLRHEKFAHLREGDNINEICPSNPEAVRLVEKMLGEVLELHKEDEYLHIGADETWNLGTCPTCSKRLEKESKLDIYCGHISKIYDFLKPQKKKIIIWCDMFWRGNSPEKVKRLPKDIILCEWIYTRPTPKGSPSMFWNGKFVYTEKFCENHIETDVPESDYIENAEAKARKFASKYLAPNPETGIGELSPYYKFFKELGFEVFGTGAARSGQSDWKFGQANMMDRFNNLRNWADFTKKKKGRCMIISSWSRGSGTRAPYSPWASAKDAIAAGAYFSWAPGKTFDDFIAWSSKTIYGCKRKELLENIYSNMGFNNVFALKNINRLEASAGKAASHIKLLKLCCEFDIFRDNFAMELLGHERKLSCIAHGICPLKGRAGVEETLSKIENLNAKIESWRKRLSEELAPYFNADDLLEYVDSRLHNLEFRLANIKSYMNGKMKKGNKNA